MSIWIGTRIVLLLQNNERGKTTDFNPEEYYIAEAAADHKAQECGIPYAVVELFDENEYSKSLGFDIVSEDIADDYAEENNGEVQHRTGPFQGGSNE